MARVARHFLTNYQVSLHWPAARQRHASAFSRVWALFRLWRRRIGERAELAQFDERSLRDIGLSGGDAYRETAKWFWQE